MDMISKDFSYSEFTASETAQKRGIDNSIPSVLVRDSIKALVLEVLQPLRDAWGRPLTVNSGYRSPVLNRAVNGVPASQHVRGEAADIRTGSEHASYELARLVYDMHLPYDQMILYPTFVHLSHRLNGEQRRQVLYNWRYHGRRLV